MTKKVTKKIQTKKRKGYGLKRLVLRTVDYKKAQSFSLKFSNIW